MAKGKEIRTQIQSIKSTQKITRAMEMESASKMRRAQDQMRRSDPYANKIRAVIGHLAKSRPEYRHPFMLQRAVKNVGIIVVSTDRGFCGGLNLNLFKLVLNHLKSLDADNVGVKTALIGRKAETFFKRINVDVLAQSDKLGEKPSMVALLGLIKVMLDHYTQGHIDAIYVAHNHFVNAMRQESVLQTLLPLPVLPEVEVSKSPWDYLYEPDAQELLDHLLMRFIESQVYHAVVDNVACEQAARMVAMKNATENAGNLIGELQLIYNKARQAAITTELTEIVAGADAV